MRKIFFVLTILICLSTLVLAEEKPAGVMIPKLTAEETKDAPIIVNSEVYPFWGVPCTNYTYYAIYKDEKGREPEYMRINLNGQWHDMKLLKGDPKTGATYVYNYVPNSGSTNFYYFEASNGVGKVRASIIDSPDNGPVLFSEKLDNNEIVLLDKSGKEIWSFDTGVDWVEGVAISKDGNYIAAGTGNAGGGRGQKIFLFDKEGNKLGDYKASHPDYEQTGDFYRPDITPDGKYVAISTGCPDRRAYLFSKEGNMIFESEQLTYDSPVHKSAISDDGSLIAYSADHLQGKEIVFLFDNQGKKLWSFSSQEDSTDRAISISSDGDYIAAGTSTGHIYLFSKNSDKPLWEYQANTWVTKVDFNGEYIVAGTGPREYFFEGESVSPDKIQCKEIIQPEPFEEYLSKMDGGDFEGGSIETEGECVGDCIEGGDKKEAKCGNDFCEPPQETFENCPEDCCPPTGCIEDSEKREETKESFKEEKVKDNEIQKKGFFEKIIDFFRRWFK